MFRSFTKHSKAQDIVAASTGASHLGPETVWKSAQAPVAAGRILDEMSLDLALLSVPTDLGHRISYQSLASRRIKLRGNTNLGRL
jgi:hypothetical protein